MQLLFVVLGLGCSGRKHDSPEYAHFTGAVVVFVDSNAASGTRISGLARFGSDLQDVDPREVTPEAGECLVPEPLATERHFFNPAFMFAPTLDAGEQIALTGSTLSVSFTRTLSDDPFLPAFYYVATTANSLAPSEILSLAAPGGADISQFVGSLVAPSGMDILEPAESEVGVIIQKSAGLPVGWISEGGTDVVQVTLDQATVQGNAVRISCSFLDTGSAIIPASALEDFVVAAQADTTTLVVSKTTFGAFTAGQAGLIYTQLTVARTWEAYLAND